jgi:hypothetical protein
MLMARSSLRLTFSTNNELLCGPRCDQMPLFKSTGVAEKAEFVVGMVSSRPSGRLVNCSEDCYAVASVGAGSTAA